MASGEASERSKATGGYVTLGLQLGGWRTGRQIARDDAHAFPPDVAVSGGADDDTIRWVHRGFGFERSRMVDGQVRSDVSTGGSGWRSNTPLTTRGISSSEVIKTLEQVANTAASLGLMSRRS